MLTSSERSEIRSGFWYALRWLIAITIIVSLAGWAAWGFGVFTSDIKGRGEAIKKKNTATNRIAAQERFEDMYADVIAADQRINALPAGTDYTTRTNLTGAATYCIQIVNEYNAEARKYTAREFRETDLPQRIDMTDPATDCKKG